MSNILMFYFLGWLFMYVFIYLFEQLVSNSPHTAAIFFALCEGHFQTIKSYSQGRCRGMSSRFPAKVFREMGPSAETLSAEWVPSLSAIAPGLPGVGTLRCCLTLASQSQMGHVRLE